MVKLVTFVKAMGIEWFEQQVTTIRWICRWTIIAVAGKEYEGTAKCYTDKLGLWGGGGNKSFDLWHLPISVNTCKSFHMASFQLTKSMSVSADFRGAVLSPSCESAEQASVPLGQGNQLGGWSRQEVMVV